MKKLDEFCFWINEKLDFFDQKYLFFLKEQELLTPEGYNKNMRIIKEKIFKTEEKEKEIQKKHKILVSEAKGFFPKILRNPLKILLFLESDIDFATIDIILAETDEKLLKSS